MYGQHLNKKLRFSFVQNFHEFLIISCHKHLTLILTNCTMSTYKEVFYYMRTCSKLYDASPSSLFETCSSMLKGILDFDDLPDNNLQTAFTIFNVL